MKRTVTACAVAAVVLVLAAGPPAGAQDLHEKVAAAKQAAAENQQALRAYTWIEKTEISLKGEVKSTNIDSCRYGPDGTVEKTPLSEPPPSKEEAGTPRGPKGRARAGLKTRVVEKKTGEMKQEMEAAVALVRQYLPPSSEKIQAAMTAGRITMAPGAATTALTIADYEKAGDSLVLTLDPAARALIRIDVDTWLDSPDEKVTLGVDMQSLPDGTSAAGTVVLAIPASKVQVRITNSEYQKLAP
jgi:hypothetical protein